MIPDVSFEVFIIIDLYVDFAAMWLITKRVAETMSAVLSLVPCDWVTQGQVCERSRLRLCQLRS